MKNDVKLIIITLGMYIINQIIKSKIPIEGIKCFMSFMRKYWLEISLEKIKID